MLHSVVLEAIDSVIHGPELPDDHETALSHQQSFGPITPTVRYEELFDVAEHITTRAGHPPEVLVELHEDDTGANCLGGSNEIESRHCGSFVSAAGPLSTLDSD
jgi:hypothetical protein